MRTSITVRNATEGDLLSWLELARQIEPLFGPMPNIGTHITRGISRGTAIVAVCAAGGAALSDAGRVDGAALLSPDGQPHHIHWLAVRAEARRRGVGSALMTKILARWNDDAPIHVVTFGPDNADGVPVRELYAAHGFNFEEHTDNGPEGGSRERWIKN